MHNIKANPMDATAIVYTKDHTDDFFGGLCDIATSLGASARDLLCVMMAESGVSAKAMNPHGHASGLIQFMPATLVNLGWREGDEAFRQLSSTAQLPFVEKYFSPHKGELTSVAAVYVATFLPALVRHASEPDYVLSAKNGQLGWAYGPNASFDANKDLVITVRELEEAVNRNCVGPRWGELIARLKGYNASSTAQEWPTTPDFRTTYGIQLGLQKLGFDPGPLDGVPGRLTRVAVMAFQKQCAIGVDGIVGPVTRNALAQVYRAAFPI